MKRFFVLLTGGVVGFLSALAGNYPITDSGQDRCYAALRPIDPPLPGDSFFGQDAQYQGLQPSYKDNGDGTVSDLITGLMWQKAVPLPKSSMKEAVEAAAMLELAGHTDWRLPTIKELYSLIDFRGVTGMMHGTETRAGIPTTSIPYINTDFFDFRYGQTENDERFIDAQWATSTHYVSTTMGGNPTVFGVNFADGRIKGYPIHDPRGGEKTFYVRCVRGPAYGNNDFVDNRDGTVTDQATGLTWMKADSGKGMNWVEALAYAEDLNLAGLDDWRLPNAKELHSIVDYTRSPDTTDSPAIDPVFESTSITNEAGQKDWGHYWTSTTHLDGPNARQAVYYCFGRGMGQMHGRTMDVHGAGAQRSDPKTGEADDIGLGHGPQGDARRIKNFVRAVRGGGVELTNPPKRDRHEYPEVIGIDGKRLQPEPMKFKETPEGAGPGNAYQKSPDGPPEPGQHQKLKSSRHPFFQRFDKDGDGKVSRREFTGPADHFRQFDKNSDAIIEASEAPTAPPPRR